MKFRLFSLFSLTVIYSITLIPQETVAFKIILNIKPSCTNLDGSPCDDCENKVLLSLLNLYLSLPPAEEKAAASERDNVMKSILGGGGQAVQESHSTQTVEHVVSKPVQEFQTETHHQEIVSHHVEGQPAAGGVETQAEQGVQQLFVEQAPSGGEGQQAGAPAAEAPAGGGDHPAGAPMDGGDDRPAD